MHIRFSFRLTAGILGLFAHVLAHAAQGVPRAPTAPAKAWVLVDYHSGQVLAAHNAEAILPPASLTKLAVSYVLFRHLNEGKLKLTDRVTVSAHAAAAKGSRMFLRAGEDVSVEQLLKGMLIISANDAAIALAERDAGTEAAFVAEMNASARRIGLMHTSFADTTGLPSTGHVSSARDVTLLASALLREFPEYASWYTHKEFTHAGIRQYNRNALLWRDASVDGIKTGHTREAGFCLVATAKRGEMRLIATILGAADENARVVAAQQLLDYGFRYFETRLLYPARTPVTKLRIWMGDSSTLSLGPARDLYLTLPRGWHERVQARVSVKQDQRAPVKAGQAVGTLSVDIDQDPVAEYPLVALEEIAAGNVFQRASDHIRLWFQ